MSEQKPIHQVFGLIWDDFLENSAFAVRREMDLSLKQQLIDLVLIRKGSEPLPGPLPDGLEDLAEHNLVTFKSHQEALDHWALLELLAHYVNYRKQTSPAMDDLLPETDFRLFAVCVRSPRNLARQVAMTPIRAGVYEVPLFALRIRVIVVHELPQEEQNARLLMFSLRSDQLQYARTHYQPRSKETSTLLYRLFLEYNKEPDMSEQLQEFVRQTIDELLKSLPPEERLKGLSAEEVAQVLSPEERLKGLSAEEVAQALSPEALEALEKLIQQRKTNGQSEKKG